MFWVVRRSYRQIPAVKIAIFTVETVRPCKDSIYVFFGSKNGHMDYTDSSG